MNCPGALGIAFWKDSFIMRYTVVPENIILILILKCIVRIKYIFGQIAGIRHLLLCTRTSTELPYLSWLFGSSSNNSDGPCVGSTTGTADASATAHTCRGKQEQKHRRRETERERIGCARVWLQKTKHREIVLQLAEDKSTRRRGERSLCWGALCGQHGRPPRCGN